VRVALTLAEQRGAFLFQIAPQFCPWPYLSSVELGLWEKFYTDKQARAVPLRALSLPRRVFPRR
jgi:hypothetical protein